MYSSATVNKTTFPVFLNRSRTTIQFLKTSMVLVYHSNLMHVQHTLMGWQWRSQKLALGGAFGHFWLKSPCIIELV